MVMLFGWIAAGSDRYVRGVTHMLTCGVKIEVVSEILGHSNFAITADLYTAVVDELKKNAADAITNAFNIRDQPDAPDEPLAATA
jgi:integrase